MAFLRKNNHVNQMPQFNAIDGHARSQVAWMMAWIFRDRHLNIVKNGRLSTYRSIGRIQCLVSHVAVLYEYLTVLEYAVFVDNAEHVPGFVALRFDFGSLLKLRYTGETTGDDQL